MLYETPVNLIKAEFEKRYDGVEEEKVDTKGVADEQDLEGAGTGPVGEKAAGNSAPQSIVIVSIG